MICGSHNANSELIVPILAAPEPLPAPVNGGLISYNAGAGYEFYYSDGVAWFDVGGANDGDVQGPLVSTDSHLSLFDGVSGKLIKNSNIKLTGARFQGFDNGGSPIPIEFNGDTDHLGFDITNIGTIAPDTVNTDLIASKTGSTVVFNNKPQSSTAPTVDDDLTNKLYVDDELSDKVVGPVVGTDNALPRYDGITGKIIQDSVVIVDDSGNLTTPGKIKSNAVESTTGVGGNVTVNSVTFTGANIDTVGNIDIGGTAIIDNDLTLGKRVIETPYVISTTGTIGDPNRALYYVTYDSNSQLLNTAHYLNRTTEADGDRVRFVLADGVVGKTQIQVYNEIKALWYLFELSPVYPIVDLVYKGEWKSTIEHYRSFKYVNDIPIDTLSPNTMIDYSGKEIIVHDPTLKTFQAYSRYGETITLRETVDTSANWVVQPTGLGDHDIVMSDDGLTLVAVNNGDNEFLVYKRRYTTTNWAFEAGYDYSANSASCSGPSLSYDGSVFAHHDASTKILVYTIGTTTWTDDTTPVADTAPVLEYSYIDTGTHVRSTSLSYDGLWLCGCTTYANIYRNFQTSPAGSWAPSQLLLHSLSTSGYGGHFDKLGETFVVNQSTDTGTGYLVCYQRYGTDTFTQIQNDYIATGAAWDRFGVQKCGITADGLKYDVGTKSYRLLYERRTIFDQFSLSKQLAYSDTKLHQGSMSGDGSLITYNNYDNATTFELLLTEAQDKYVSNDMVHNNLMVANDSYVGGNLVALQPGNRVLHDHGELYQTVTGAATSVSTTYVALTSGTFTLGHGDNFVMDTPGRLQYKGTIAGKFHVSCSWSVSAATGSVLISMGCCKNGTVYPGSVVNNTITTATNEYSGGIVVVADLDYDDEIYIMGKLDSGTQNITVTSLNVCAIRIN